MHSNDELHQTDADRQGDDVVVEPVADVPAEEIEGPEPERRPLFSEETRKHFKMVFGILLCAAWLYFTFSLITATPAPLTPEILPDGTTAPIQEPGTNWLRWAGIALLALVVLFFGSKKIPSAHRAVLTILGWRLKVAVIEGFWLWLPWVGDFLVVDVRERVLKFTVDHLSKDAFPVIATVEVYYHPARRSTEVGGGFDGNRLRAYTDLGDGVASYKVESLSAAAVERGLVTHDHEDLTGVCVRDLLTKQIKQKKADENKDATVDSSVVTKIPDISKATRFRIGQAVLNFVDEILFDDGIDVIKVVIKRIDFNDKTKQAIADVVERIFEKEGDEIDLRMDLDRAEILMKKINNVVAEGKEDVVAEGKEVTLMECYRAIRDLDNKELAAKSGLGGSLLESLVASAIGH